MISVKQNDRRPAAAATLKHGTTIVPLTLASSVTFKMKPINDSEMKVNAAAVIVDAAAGEVEYRWAVGDTDTAGEFLGEWEVIWSDGTPETFPTIDFDRVIIHPDLD
jgi:hypothetical protein